MYLAIINSIIHVCIIVFQRNVRRFYSVPRFHFHFYSADSIWSVTLAPVLCTVLLQVGEVGPTENSNLAWQLEDFSSLVFRDND